ncbi:tautomerase family protein [soil metagenome]
MPLVRISLRKGKSPQHLSALAEGVHQALRAAFGVPENNKFTLIHEHEDSAFICDPSYFGVERSHDLVVIQITVNDTRNAAQKADLFKAITHHLAIDPGLRPEDCYINLLEVKAENWSLGNGEQQYGPKPAP